MLSWIQALEWSLIYYLDTVHGQPTTNQIQLLQLRIPRTFRGPISGFIAGWCSCRCRKSSFMFVGLPQSLARQLRTLFWQGHLRPGCKTGCGIGSAITHVGRKQHSGETAWSIGWRCQCPANRDDSQSSDRLHALGVGKLAA